MKRNVIDVKSLKDVTPQYQTWFRLQEDVIFVSVIHIEKSNRKSHLRRKSKPRTNQNKKDNEMCFWHSDWQFSKIENEYGFAKSGVKTYEITIKVDNEIHRIDSLVEYVAIEFQHTLSVSINEMESRYAAHKTMGYVPYLVLDFTEYSSDLITNTLHLNLKQLHKYSSSNEKCNQLLKKLKKWLSSKYYLNKNLFLDFRDQLIRLTPGCLNQFYKYERGFFTKNLLQMEILLQKAEQFEASKKAEEKAKSEEKLKQKLAWQKEQKILDNEVARLNSPYFKYYRKSIANSHIQKAVTKHIGKPEYINYRLREGEHGSYYRKVHIYRFYKSIEIEPELEIQYSVLGEYEGNIYSFFKSEINVIIKTGQNNIGIRRMLLIQEAQRPIKLISIRNEIAKYYLHNLAGYALISYDQNEKVESEKYYIFNNRLPEHIFEEIAEYYNSWGYSKVDSLEGKKFLESIQMQDNHGNNFIENIYQNYLPIEKLEGYYSELDEVLPFEDNESFTEI